MPKELIGYILCGDSYVWTKRGVLKVQELEETDDILGLDIEKREPTFQKLTSCPRKLREGTSIRITTDVNEIIVPEQAKLYLINGKKIASNVVEGDELDIFYRPKTFDMLRNLYDSNEAQHLRIGPKEIEVSENFAYLLGTQAIVQSWAMHKIVMQLESDMNCGKICSILKQALHDIGLRYDLDYKIFYRPDRKKIIVIDQSADGFITKIISEIFQPENVQELSRALPQKMPKIIRLSPTNIMKQFIEGVLDSRAKISRGGLVKFYTFARDNEVRRFILSILALFNIQPRYSFVNKPEWGLATIYTYLALPKERLFNLKSLAIASEEALTHKTRDDVKLYSVVKNIARFKRSQYLIPSPKEHWDIIADLVPLHSQKLSLQIQKSGVQSQAPRRLSECH